MKDRFHGVTEDEAREMIALYDRMIEKLGVELVMNEHMRSSITAGDSTIPVPSEFRNLHSAGRVYLAELHPRLFGKDNGWMRSWNSFASGCARGKPITPLDYYGWVVLLNGVPLLWEYAKIQGYHLPEANLKWLYGWYEAESSTLSPLNATHHIPDGAYSQLRQHLAQVENIEADPAAQLGRTGVLPDEPDHID